MGQTPLNDVMDYIIAKGYDEITAKQVAGDLEKVRKLTLPNVNKCLSGIELSRKGIAELKEKMGANKVVEEHPMDREPERSTYKEHPMDREPERSTYKEHPMDKEEHLPLNIEINQGAPEPLNVNRNIKLTKSFDDKLKQRAKELKISVSALIRTNLTKIYCE